MSRRIGTLAPLMRALPPGAVRRGQWSFADLAGGIRLVIGPRRLRDTEIARAAGGLGGAAARSHGCAAGRWAVVLAAADRVGVDIETRPRVALNTAIDDDWLAPAERELARGSVDITVELACHWVLKEAYGKALGTGLSMPLAELAFGGRNGSITLTRGDRQAAGWRFGLYHEGEAILGVAYRPGSGRDTVRARGQKTASAVRR